MSPSDLNQAPLPGWTVTISRQMGSLGMEVAQAAASLLHYRTVCQDLIQAAAKRAGTPEMALAFIDDLGLLDVCPSPESCQAFRQAISEFMHEYAEAGGVLIVGRAGQVILYDHPKVLHVRIIAPQTVRVERIARAQGISPESALAQMEASDRSRKTYLGRFYQVHWGEPSLYHLILNTARFTPERAAVLIQTALLTIQLAAELPENRRSTT